MGRAVTGKKRSRFFCESYETGYRPRTRRELCLTGVSEHACAVEERVSTLTLTPHVSPEVRLFVTRQESKII